MTRTEFYKGWQICIMECGNLDMPSRYMMAFKSDKTLDFQGGVWNDDLAIESAKRVIDEVEATPIKREYVSVTIVNDNQIDDFPEYLD